MNIPNDKNTMSCPIKINSNTIELTVHNSRYWVLDLLCVKPANLTFGVEFFFLVFTIQLRMFSLTIRQLNKRKFLFWS